MRKLLFIILCLLSSFSWAQKTRVISGKVISGSDKMPLIGATVYIDTATIGQESEIKGVIENLAMGTITDLDGNFSFKVPTALETISCSFLGFETITINIINQQNVRIVLNETNNSLGEVVVTGYQKIEKRKLTSAVVKVNADKILQAGVVSVDQMLGGQLAGVTSSVTSGAPGAPAKIRIRGTASLNGTSDPLWVLDGVPMDGNEVPNYNDSDNIDQLYNSSVGGLNPQDIQDITILKDAAATAIYGARAANGVIVITTKKGKKGKMRVSFNSNTTIISRPDFDRLNLMNSTEKVDVELLLAAREDLIYRSGNGEVARILNTNSDLANYRSNGIDGISSESLSAINALRNTNTNVIDELYQTAVNQDQSISISGGSDFANYYFSAGLHSEKGTTIGTSLDRYNITLKTDFNLRHNLKFGVSIFANQRKNNSYLTGASLLTNPSNYVRMVNPYQSLRDENGDYVYINDESGVYNTVFVPFNILEERDGTSHTLESRNINATFDLEWKINNNFKYRTQLGIQTNNTNTTKSALQETYYTRKELQKSRYYNSDISDYDYYMPKKGGIIKNWDSRNFSYNLKNILEYYKKFDNIHELEVMVGNEIRMTERSQVFGAGYGWDSNSNSTIPLIYREAKNESSFPLFSKNYNKNTYASFFATGSYTYNKKYTFFGSIRYDGSNLFGVDPKYKYLPLYALSGAWNASEETFLRKQEWLSNLKFRASYGLQGNIDKSSSPFIIGERKINTILPGNTESSIDVTNAPNNKLRWEKTRTYNVGSDLSILHHSIRMSFDYYDRLGTDLIGLKSLPLESGFSSMSVNWAEMTNKGWEFSVSTRNISTENFKWNSSFNISQNKNKVLKELVSDKQYLPSREGYSANTIWVIKTAGLDENGYPLYMKDGVAVTGKEFLSLKDTYPEMWPGNVSSTDLSVAQTRDLFVSAGSSDPKYSGGLINNFSYKNFDLSISASFNLGMKVLGQPSYSMIEYDRGRNSSNLILDALQGKGKYPNLLSKDSNDKQYWMEHQFFNFDNPGIYRHLDIWLKEINYLRISSIRLGYRLSKEALNRLNLSSVRFTLEARNPFVIANSYDGFFDPESYGNMYAQPQQKTYSIGVNIGF